MKPTCPTACPLKRVMEQHKESAARSEEMERILEQLDPASRRQVLAYVTFLYYRHLGLTKFSTWIEMEERQRVLYFIWGFFEKLDFAMIKGRW